jgi:pimeloyl-ACP methyl ester carboxylesterase
MRLRKHLALAALVGLLGVPAFSEQAPAPPSGWTDGFVIANGIRIHYWRTGGEKPALVLAHGFSDNGLCWTALAKELEDRYDVIMPDARGHGLSDPGSESDAADVQADDLNGFIQQLKLTKPIVMGHSMGAAAAASFAAKYPEVPRAVILEDPGMGPRRGGGGGNTSVEQRRAQILARNNTSYDELVAGCIKNSPSWGEEECRIWAPSKRLHHPNTAYRRIGERRPMNELFAEITAPALILKADAEPEVRKQNEEIAAVLKSGKIVHIDGAGHNVRREQKQRLLEALNSFLASL